MQLFFADDARQDHPTREGMNPLVAAGGICVRDDNMRALETGINEVCADCGFRAGEEFKWSPGREQWMWQNLIGDQRRDFQVRVLNVARDLSVVATVIIADVRARPATGAASPEDDVTWMLLERVNRLFGRDRSDGIVIVDLPPGGRADEMRFLSKCASTIQQGTAFSAFDSLALNVITSPSRTTRLLQLADLVTSCTLARISGERRYSPAAFEGVLGLLDRDGCRIGGIGVKLHPDFKYANLYHWLLGDTHFHRMGQGVPYPLKGRPYHAGVDVY